MQARLHVLGAPYLEVDGQIVEMDTRKAIALLAYLALGESRPGSSHTRDALATLLYPDSDQASARAALRRTLSPLRKALDNTCLEADREQLRVHLDNLWVDAVVFKQALAQTRLHGHAPGMVCPDCLPLLEKAASLYQEGFMSGFSLRDSAAFDEWQFFHSEALRRELAEVLEKLVRGLAARGDFKTATSHARRWLTQDPLNENAHRQLMLLYAWDNQRNAALRQYRECVRILDQELGVAPLEETTHLYQAVLENHLPPVPELAAASALSQEAVPGQSPVSPTPNPARNNAFSLFGRSDELVALRKLYAQGLSRQEKKFVLAAIEGEAGIGKTRLAEAFLAELAAQGVNAFQARCYEGERDLAYAPFLSGLGEAVASPGATLRMQSLSPAALGMAAQLVPTLAELFPGLPPPPAPDSPGAQVRFLDALRMVIQSLVAPDPGSASLGVIFLDDVQWMDAASLAVLDYMTRRLEGVFLLLAWRGDLVPPGHALRHLMAQVQRTNPAANLILPRLRLEDVAAMAAAANHAFTPQQMARLYLETEGNPFFVTEYLDRVNPLDETAEIPLGVRSLLENRLASAGELGRQILSAAAVLGRSFDFSILREVSGRSDIEVIAALEDLLQHNLVSEHTPVEGAANLQYDFTHDKLREAAYAQASLARRRLLHGRAAEAFAGRVRAHREAAALAAFHYRLAGQLDQAARWYQAAGENARAVYANQDAIAYLKSALACGHPEPAILHEAIGDISLLTGQYGAALTSYETAAASCPPQRLALIEHRLGRVHNQLGNFELAECHLQIALESLAVEAAQTAPILADRAMILADWSYTAHRRGDQARALELALQAVELSQHSQDARAIAQAYNNLGILERVNGQFPKAIQHLQNSLDTAIQLADLGSQAAALNNLARVYAESGQPDQAIRLTEQALTLCEQCGDRHRAAALLNNLADLFHTTGQEQTAMEYLRKAVVIFAEIGMQIGSASGTTPTTDPALFPEVWKLREW
jgi:predicted ATPase/DNA-binding SARP family transcriptional activator